ncbi:O-antigen ligase family protein [Nocardioides sp. NPDC057772]|uniref:O-antigen ligase family protein n=1 Tax=Nocardioides sp. NPDC057772 TaxID=3346245 RepID=UPI00366CFA53
MTATVKPLLGGAILAPTVVAVICLWPALALPALCLVALLTGAVLFGAERAGGVMVTLALFTAPMNELRPIPGLNIVTYCDLFLVLGFALLAPSISHRRLRLPVTFAIGALILAVATVTASLLSADPVTSLNYGSRLLATVVALPLAFAAWRPTGAVIDRLAWAYVAGQVVSTLVGVIDGPIDTGRYVGLSTHPNLFGLAAVIAAGLLVHLAHRSGSIGKVAAVGAGGVFVAAGLMSGSRAAIVAIALIALLYPLIERSFAAAYAIAWTALLAFFSFERMVSLSGEGSALARLQGDETARTSDQIRKVAIQDGLHDFLARPLAGNGFANALEAHDIYLQIAVTTGLFGLVGYLMIFWPFVSPLLTRGPMHRLAYAAAAYGAVGLITASLWDRLVGAGIALCLLAGRATEDDEPPPVPNQPTPPEAAPSPATRPADLEVS